jgi:hypothetical protein
VGHAYPEEKDGKLKLLFKDMKPVSDKSVAALNKLMP